MYQHVRLIKYYSAELKISKNKAMSKIIWFLLFLILLVAFLVTPWNLISSKISFVSNTTSEERFFYFKNVTEEFMLNLSDNPWINNNRWIYQGLSFYEMIMQFVKVSISVYDPIIRHNLIVWAENVEYTYYQTRDAFLSDLDALKHKVELTEKRFFYEQYQDHISPEDVFSFDTVLHGGWIYTNQMITGTLVEADLFIFLFSRYISIYARASGLAFYIFTDVVVADMFVINISLFLMMSVTKELVFRMSNIMFMGNLKYWMYSKYYDVLINYGFFEMVMSCITLFLCIRVFVLLIGLPWLLNLSGIYLIGFGFILAFMTLAHNLKSEIKYKVELKIDATIKIIKSAPKPKINVLVVLMVAFLAAIWDPQPLVVRLFRTASAFRPLAHLRAPNKWAFHLFWITSFCWIPFMIVDVLYYMVTWVIVFAWVYPYINNREVAEDKWAEITNAAHSRFVLVSGYTVWEHDGYLFNTIRSWALVWGWLDDRQSRTESYSQLAAGINDFIKAYPKTSKLLPDLKFGDSVSSSESIDDEDSDGEDYKVIDEEGAAQFIEQLKQEGRALGDITQNPELSGFAGSLLSDPVVREKQRRQLDSHLQNVFLVTYSRFEPTFEVSDKIKAMIAKPQRKPGFDWSTVSKLKPKDVSVPIETTVALNKLEQVFDPEVIRKKLGIPPERKFTVDDIDLLIKTNAKLLIAKSEKDLEYRMICLRYALLTLDLDVRDIKGYTTRPKLSFKYKKGLSDQDASEIYTQGLIMSGQEDRFRDEIKSLLTEDRPFPFEGRIYEDPLFSEQCYRVILYDTYMRLIDKTPIEVLMNSSVAVTVEATTDSPDVEIIPPPPGFDRPTKIVILKRPTDPIPKVEFVMELKDKTQEPVIPMAVRSYIEYDAHKEYRIFVIRQLGLKGFMWDLSTLAWLVEEYCTTDSTRVSGADDLLSYVRWLRTLNEHILIPGTIEYIGSNVLLNNESFNFILKRLERCRQDTEGIERFILDTKDHETRRKRMTYFFKLNYSYLHRFIGEMEILNILKELGVTKVDEIELYPVTKAYLRENATVKNPVSEFNYLNGQSFEFRKAIHQPKHTNLEFLGVQDKYDMPAAFTYGNHEMIHKVKIIDPQAPIGTYQTVKADDALILESIKKYEGKRLEFKIDEEYAGVKLDDYIIRNLDILLSTNKDYRVGVLPIDEFSVEDLSPQSRKTFPGYQCRNTYHIQHKSDNIPLAKSLAKEYRLNVLKGIPIEHIWDLIPIPKASKVGQPQIRTILAPEYYFYINQYCIFKGLKEIISQSPHSKDFSPFFGHFDDVCKRFPRDHMKENLDLKDQGGSVPYVFGLILYRWYSRFLENDEDRIMFKHCIDNIFKATFMIPKHLGGGVWRKENGWGDGPYGTNQVDLFFMICYYIVNVWDNCKTLGVSPIFDWRIVLEGHGDNWLHSYNPLDAKFYSWNNLTLNRLGQKVKGVIVKSMDIKDCELMGYSIKEVNGNYVGMRSYDKTVKSLTINRRKPTSTPQQRSYEAGLIHSLWIVDCWNPSSDRLLASLHNMYRDTEPATVDIETRQRVMLLQHTLFNPKEAWSHSQPLSFDSEDDPLSRI